MKDHKEKKVHVNYSLEGHLPEVIERLLKEAEGMVNPMIISEYVGYDGPDDYYVVGWIPMTDDEKKKAREKRKKDREYKAAAKKKREVEELEDLLKTAGRLGISVELSDEQRRLLSEAQETTVGKISRR